MQISIATRHSILASIVAALVFAGAQPRAAIADTKSSSDSKASATVDLNKATEAQLQEVPGIGEATAKKIIKGRPYKSVDDLSKAGVPEATITKIRSHVSIAADKATAKEDKLSSSSSNNKTGAKADKSMAKNDKASTSSSSNKLAVNDDKSAKLTINDEKPNAKTDKAKSTDDKADKSTKPAVVDSKTALVNVNKASETELETVAGIGPTYARKIIEKRPYKSIDDLSKAGIPTATISKIRPLVTTSDSVASQVTTKPATPDKAPAVVDINKATAEQLQEVPGIGEAYSKKIIDNRPYKSVDDLSKAGIPAAVIEKVKANLTVGGTSAAVAPPAKGMVWVNLDTKLYHKESSRWYGKTKEGKYMTEAEAVKAGYTASKQ